jgi:hypothetical protein
MTRVQAMNLVTRALLKRDIRRAQELTITHAKDLGTETFTCVLTTAVRTETLLPQFEAVCKRELGEAQYLLTLTDILTEKAKHV